MLNSGYAHSGSITRGFKDRTRRYSVFAPLAIAAIGTLPLPLQRRTIKIHMHRNSSKLRQLDLKDPTCTDELNQVYGLLCAWARMAKLNTDPALPVELRNASLRDNWRPLISVADSFGGQWPAIARAAAIEFARQLPHEDDDVAVLLLRDIRMVFGARDRIASERLVADLLAIEDGLWLEYRGVDGDRPPRKLSQTMLSDLLRPFGIRPTYCGRGPSIRSKSCEPRSSSSPGTTTKPGSSPATVIVPRPGTSRSKPA